MAGVRTDGRKRAGAVYPYIPKGLAHGFQTLTDDAEIAYQISAFYARVVAGGDRYDDAAFGIAWPLPVTVISERDLGWPAFTL